jgi:beta-lactamase superfamily II metal-dependent hydrolase
LVAAHFIVLGMMKEEFPFPKKPGIQKPVLKKGMWGGLLLMWGIGLPLVYAAREKPPFGTLSVAWLDVGNGNAQVVTGPAGQVTLVDGGPEWAGAHRVVPYLGTLPATRLHQVILTRPDPRHADGLIAVLQEYEIDKFLCTRSAWEDPAWEDGRQIIEAKKIPIQILTPGDSWKEDGVSWQVLGSGDSEEEGISLLMEMGEDSVLFTGDLPRRNQADLLASLSRPVSVLQWPDHGRVRPDFDFLAGAKPRWIVVSASRPKDFVDSLPLSPPIRITGREGSLMWKTDGKTSSLKSMVEKPAETRDLAEF